MAKGILSDTAQDWFLFICAASASSIALFFFLKEVFSDRAPLEQPDNPASHFHLKEILSERSITYLGTLCALPFATLFLILCLKASTLVAATKELAATYLGSLLQSDYEAKFNAVLSAIPPWLDPLFVLACALLLFAPIIRIPFIAFRDAVFAILDIDDRVNDIAIDAAERTIAEYGDNERAEQTLQVASRLPDLPLPVALAQARDSTRLSYQLLFVARDRTRVKGLEAGLQETLATIDVAWTSKQRAPLPWGYVFAAITFYGVLCGCYAVFAPLIAPWLRTSDTVFQWLQQVEWPAYHDELSLSIAQRTLSFIIPLAFGMYLFARRRALQANEPWMQAFIVVASVQFSFALVVNIAFAIISVAQSATGEYTGLLTFADAKLWGNVLVYSLTPAVALFAWVASGRLGLGTAGTTLVICVAAGISFCGSQFAFEAISTFRGYYWHQMVLGSFITMSYGLAALLAGSVLPWKPMQEAPSIRSRFFGASPVPYEG